MVKYDLTDAQRERCYESGGITITRGGKKIGVSPSMLSRKTSSYLGVHMGEGNPPDATDIALAKKWLAKWDKDLAPRVGDYIRMRNGKYEQFTHYNDDAVYVARYPLFFMDANGVVDRSGSGHIIDRRDILKTPEKKLGVFLLGRLGNDRWGYVVIDAGCRVYEQKSIGVRR